MRDLIVLVKGGGEMASGVVHRLVLSGFRVCITEISQPMAVRREVAFCEAVYEDAKEVEGLKAVRVQGKEEIIRSWGKEQVPVLVDPECSIRPELSPDILVDAIMAKRNLGTHLDDAPLVIGLGPGFCARVDVHYGVETNRGHFLGRVIEEGKAEPDTGTPGEVEGYTWERVLRAPGAGEFLGKKRIGDRVEKGEIVAEVAGRPVTSPIDGILRGILRSGLEVVEGMKIGDVDPRAIREHCFTISDKARSIGGGVLEAILRRYNNKDKPL